MTGSRIRRETSKVGWMEFLFPSTFKRLSIGMDHHFSGMLKSTIGMRLEVTTHGSKKNSINMSDADSFQGG